ncbi:MAG: protein-(glutamine-N5) methyltransferase, release factor-specific [Polynucleobacter sp. 39-45-136]|nr:MAG: protein-(glutamine-N5) methyltransferase, release factor-specific [Polynucleobacter sp. 39-45-136]
MRDQQGLATNSLKALLSSSALPGNEARILLAHVIETYYQLPRSALLSRDDMVLNESAYQAWQQLEQRRMNGEPIAYILGKKGFHAIELMVAPGVELLVDIALDEIGRIKRPCQILDMGTGSGAIALAIASACAHSAILATDQSSDALAIAKINAQNLHLDNRVQFFQGDWYTALTQHRQFDVIVSNPPYIANADHHLTQGDLRFEPASALTDYASGLSCLESIISGANSHLLPGALLAVEHGFDQSDAVAYLMKDAGLHDIQVHLDLAGHKRAVSARKMA